MGRYSSRCIGGFHSFNSSSFGRSIFGAVPDNDDRGDVGLLGFGALIA